MNNFVRHIELLLLEHDCVIVPGFGGFIANSVPARYEARENLFIPPYRTIAFNQNLSANDGLLVQSYMQTFDAAYPEAFRQLEKDINSFVSCLDCNSKVDMGTLGTLSRDINGTITLQAPESGINTPSLYGTCSFTIRTIEDIIAATKTQEESDNFDIEDQTDDKHRTSSDEEKKIPSRKGIFDNVVDIGIAAAVAAIMFFLFVPQSTNPEPNTKEDICIAGSLFVKDKLSTRPSEKVTPLQNNPSNSGATETKKENVAPITAATEDASDTKTVTEIKEKTKIEGSYTIVLASCVTKANSELYISQMQKKGYSEAQFLKGKKVSRVIYGSYKTESEAQESLRKYRSELSDFNNAWILKL